MMQQALHTWKTESKKFHRCGQETSYFQKHYFSGNWKNTVLGIIKHIVKADIVTPASCVIIIFKFDHNQAQMDEVLTSEFQTEKNFHFHIVHICGL